MSYSLLPVRAGEREVTMPIDYTLLGQRIAHYRSLASLSQEKLSEMIPINSHYLSNIETGRAKPSSDLLVDIAAALNVSVDDLLVDSLHGVSEKMHQLLLECSPTKKEILYKNAEHLKNLLDDLNIK